MTNLDYYSWLSYWLMQAAENHRLFALNPLILSSAVVKTIRVVLSKEHTIIENPYFKRALHELSIISICGKNFMRSTDFHENWSFYSKFSLLAGALFNPIRAGGRGVYRPLEGFGE